MDFITHTIQYQTKQESESGSFDSNKNDVNSVSFKVVGAGTCYINSMPIDAIDGIVSYTNSMPVKDMTRYDYTIPVNTTLFIIIGRIVNSKVDTAVLRTNNKC